ncbi:MAG: LptF/LptG family permease [Bacteroidaceae bacterium]|nr:LptF/LptG family permease [Bacteroidaceae bacterium]MBQ8695147.1 LptF/LptG family permease [Bacteroidaceae bacterium]MBR3615912.1 LptF/LptG family permease [Bacteroidaceae bacterium]
MKWLDYFKLQKLDWYIIKKFLGTYFFSLALIIVVIVVFDYNEKIDKFATSNATTSEIIFDYYLNLAPYYANTFSALFVFISVIYFTSKLADNSEIIAMFASGVSFGRLMKPYMVSAGLIAIMTFVLSAYIIPQGNSTRLAFEQEHNRKKKIEAASNIQVKLDDNTIAFIERYESRNNMGWRFSLDRFEGKKLVSRMTANNISYNPDKPGVWTARRWVIRELKDDKEVIRSSNKETIDTVLPLEPTDFLISEGEQETMTSPQLSEYIDKQKARGMGNIKPFEVEYHKRIAMSFAAFILTIIGASLSSRKRKGGMGLSLGIGLGLSFSYIMFQTVSSAFAEQMPVILAVWIPNILFTFIAIYLYRRAPR